MLRCSRVRFAYASASSFVSIALVPNSAGRSNGVSVAKLHVPCRSGVPSGVFASEPPLVRGARPDSPDPADCALRDTAATATTTAPPIAVNQGARGTCIAYLLIGPGPESTTAARDCEAPRADAYSNASRPERG